MIKINSKNYIIIGLGILLLCGITTYCVIYIRAAINEARIIEQAINNPQKVEAGKLLRKINKSFKTLPKTEQQRILQNPEKLNAAVSEAMYKNMEKSFRLLFKLPKPLRKKIIEDSTAKLRAKSNRIKRIDSFVASQGGKAALQGATKFFWLGLSGKEKAEVAPLIAAVQKIMNQSLKRRSRR